MFGIGWAELLLVAIIALFVIDPKDLPKVLYQCGRAVRSIRLFFINIQNTVEDTFRDIEVDEVKRQLEQEQQKALPPVIDENGKIIAPHEEEE